MATAWTISAPPGTEDVASQNLVVRRSTMSFNHHLLVAVGERDLQGPERRSIDVDGMTLHERHLFAQPHRSNLRCRKDGGRHEMMVDRCRLLSKTVRT